MAVVQKTRYSGTKTIGLFADVHTTSILRLFKPMAVREFILCLVSMAMPNVPLSPVNMIDGVVDVDLGRIL